MSKQWSVDTVGIYKVYRRVMRATRGIITGSVWFEPSAKRYRWMATSDMTVRLGVSRSLEGAMAGCSRAMHRLRREIDRTQ